ncbi:MAG: hypothetical protein DWQ34_17800 [Planctomycetota bacterium]|nr:MAG: hypothetical protein DWQ29_06850 [Planctomycetota bacterium]REJ90218.1 MAG: hypothetical protein DWQ34_17800 [Planctomycetota bacterium]REK28148.1 MAG: hypothetical protein DWQ41_06260 [Planctomycetota bacterium]REK36047.1 MAG: hypothetical protein DWQ45_10195 [Planctomycetota bacterium]
MFGVPSDVDFKFLLGAQLDAIDQFDQGFILRLSNGRTIQVEGGYHVFGVNLAGSPATLTDLVSQRVARVQVSSRSELQIVFTPRITLTLYDDSPDYECIVIDPEGIVI